MTLPDGLQEGAVVLGLALRAAMESGPSLARAGFGGTPFEAADKLFQAVLESPSGVVFAVDEWSDMASRIATPDKKLHVVLPDLLAELDQTMREAERPEARDTAFPFVLSAGERRSFTANTIMRDPTWRKTDVDGALRMSPADGASLGVATGDAVTITTKRGSVTVTVEISESMQPGHLSLPNGLGLAYPGDGGAKATGVAPNELTSSEDRDRFAGTPWHKYVPARVERASAAG
jgi:anaerobic selenocysteine-containing dehydrogenase